MEGKHIDSVDQYCVLGKGENMVLQWKGKDALLPLQKRKKGTGKLDTATIANHYQYSLGDYTP